MAQFQLFDIPKNQTEFSTKEVMAITGFTKEALRYYEKLDILGFIKRDTNNYRRYSANNLQRMQIIRIFQYTGMELTLLKEFSDHDPIEKHLKVYQDYQVSLQEHIQQLIEISEFIDKKIEYLNERKSSNKN